MAGRCFWSVSNPFFLRTGEKNIGLDALDFRRRGFGQDDRVGRARGTVSDGFGRMNWSNLIRRTNANVIPGLDGLRAISILCVIYAHLLWTPGFPLKSFARILNPAD